MISEMDLQYERLPVALMNSVVCFSYDTERMVQFSRDFGSGHCMIMEIDLQFGRFSVIRLNSVVSFC